MSNPFGGGLGGSNPTQGDIQGDKAINQPPEDGISAISFSSVAPPTGHDFLAASSWSNKTIVYEIDAKGESRRQAEVSHDGPVLACCWSTDGQKLISAGADKMAKMLDLNAAHGQAATPVAMHDQPIKCVKMFQHQGNDMLVTGSWDKTVKYWDLRQQNPAATLNCQERVYTIDIRNQLLVIGTADRYLNIVNLGQPDKFYKTMQSPLKWQTRVVSCFTDATGFAVGSIEGRCAIQYVEEKDAPNNFSFKCHRKSDPNRRDQTDVFAVNAISFHPQHGTFSTAGSDGTFHFWDKDAKHRLKGYPEVGGAISATDFSRNGNIFAYAVSYDWSKGYAHNTPNLANKIMLHAIKEDECKPRPGGKKR